MHTHNSWLSIFTRILSPNAFSKNIQLLFVHINFMLPAVLGDFNFLTISKFQIINFGSTILQITRRTFPSVSTSLRHFLCYTLLN